MNSTENNNMNKIEKEHVANTPFWKGVFNGALGSSLIIATVLGVALNGAIIPSEQNKVYSQTTAVNSQTLNDFELAIVGAVEQVGDAVVSVNNLQAVQMQTMNRFDYGYSLGGEGTVDLQDPEASLQLAGSGSGVVYKIDGDTAYIVTNNHVVEGAEKLEIVTANGETVDAELVGTDVFTDLAVLKVSSEHVKTLMNFADSDALKVGSLAIAIGSPLGSEFSSSVTQGIVSGVNRLLPIDINHDGSDDWEATLIQTDAAINPGNSGGALINKNGELIGINSNKLADTDIEGMGFAIPSNEVKNVIAQLETNGEVTRPVLGVAGVIPVEQLSIRSKVEVLGLAEDVSEGVVVSEVAEGSAAQVAGLEKYDVILSLDDVAINDLKTLRQELYKHQIGDTVTLKISRLGEEQTIQVNLTATTEE